MTKTGLSTLILFLFIHLTAMAVQPAPPLDGLRWEYRLIIGKISDPDEVKELQKQWQDRREALADRKLALILATPTGIQTTGLKQGLKVDDKANDEIIQMLKGQELALVGLDGGVKSRYALKDFSFASVFGQIDQMPMRINELRSQSE